MSQLASRCRWAGLALILLAAAVPSSGWIHFLRGIPPAALQEQLLLGGALLRVALIVLGVFFFLLPRLWVSSEKSPLRGPSGHLRNAKLNVLAGVILISAFCLRLYKLDSGLWLDEILTYVSYARMPFGEIVSTYASENQHFLFSLMAHASFQIFGESAWALRLPAVLFGVGSLLALYLLGRQLTTPREALFATALLAFSYHHVWFSQNARGYTGLLFWTLLASWLLVRCLREETLHLWLLYAAACALGAYTHTTMLFVVVGQFIGYLGHLLVYRSHNAQRWNGLLGFCTAGLFTIVLHALVLPQVVSGMSRTVSVVDAWKKPLWTLLQIVDGLQASFAGGVVAFAALFVFSAGLWSYARTNIILLHMLFWPPVIGASLVLAVGHHLWPRFFFFSFGYCVLVVIRGTVQIEYWAARFVKAFGLKPAWVGTALCAGLVAVSAASVPFAFGPKQEYRGALEFAQAQRGPGDAVVSVGLASFPYTALYKASVSPVETLEELQEIRGRSNKTILLYTLAPVLEATHPQIVSMIRRDFRACTAFRGTLQDGTVFVCLSPKSATEARITKVHMAQD